MRKPANELKGSGIRHQASGKTLPNAYCLIPNAFLFLLYIAMTATAAESSRPAAAPLKTFVGILPEAYFVERIGGAHVTVDVLVGPGQSPHTFEPAPRQMVDLGKARLYFTIGMPFEGRLVAKIKAAVPDLVIVDLRQGIKMRMMTADEQAADDDHDPSAAGQRAEGQPGGPRSVVAADATERVPPAKEPQGEPDPHVWLSPANARIMAKTVTEALIAADPAHAEEFRKNAAALDVDLEKIDAQLAETLKPLKGKPVLVYHPAFGYFTDRYGLRQVPVEIGGKEPSVRQLTELVARAKKDGTRVIFVEPQFSARSARAVAEAIGGAVIPLDDLAKDYLANMADMAEKIRKALIPS
jgi:zinc transport system substrate-binding protein